MVQAYSLIDTLIQNSLLKNFRETSFKNLAIADDAAFCVDTFVQYFLAAIEAYDVNQIRECSDLAERLFSLNEEGVAGILSMHLITNVFPALEKKIPSHTEIKHLLSGELLFYFNYSLIVENNWLY
jgi:hypothetical protein